MVDDDFLRDDADPDNPPHRAEAPFGMASIVMCSVSFSFHCLFSYILLVGFVLLPNSESDQYHFTGTTMSFSFSGNNGMASGTVVHWRCQPNRLVWRRFSEFLFFHEWERNEHVIPSGSKSTGNVQTVFANLGFFFCISFTDSIRRTTWLSRIITSVS